MRFAAMMVGLTLFLACGVQSESAVDESVVLVKMAFEGGQWTAKPLEVLPCPGPSKPDPLTRQRSAIQLTDGRSKVLYRRHITNPRIILVEDPKETARLLSEVEFTLAVPLVEGASDFQFYEREQDLREAYGEKRQRVSMASADLREVIATYEKRRPTERASCQIIVPKPEDPRLLGEVIDTAISIETISSMIAVDQHVLVQRGLELDLAPKELRQLIYEYEDHWADVHVTEKDVAEFLKRYAVAYREAVEKR